MVEDIFEEEMNRRRIFKDTSILSPHYVPDELPHREAEIRNITRSIAPVLRNEKPSNLFIYGKTGTGKTCAVKYVMRKLKEFAGNQEKNPKGTVVKTVYMNCKVRDTKYKVLLKILEDEKLNDSELENTPLLDRPHKSLKGMDPGDLYDRLFNVVDSNKINLIVVLDEIDMIKKGFDDLIYILTRINDELKHGTVSIIGLTNDMKALRRMDPRSRSTLCQEERVFKPYNAVQLKTILQQRIEQGFQEDVVESSVTALIAAFAAQDGDARYALKLLSKSGEIARDESAPNVLNEHVEKAKEAVESDIIIEAISSLPEHQQLVIYSIASLTSEGGMYKRLSGLGGGDLFTGEVYEAYERYCNLLERKARTIRQFSEYLNELEMLGLITMRISGKGTRGTTRFIRLGYSPDEIRSILRKTLGLELRSPS
ncbi:MAG: cell division control protein Cdc6 [Candidatus Altiarchaeales archaeon ex4484_96]|nr:MAG: cell division control protein Cdc6 [Candidatus Altiarchaeales archaeon ex4484_96]